MSEADPALAAEPPPAAAQPKRRARTMALGIIKVAVSLGLLAWIFSRLDLAAVGARIEGAAPWALLAAVGIEVVAIVLATWRWARVLEAQDLALPFRRAFGLFYAGQFLNQALPANVAGDAFRSWRLFRGGAAALRAVVAVLFDRIIGLTGLVLVAALGLPYLVLRSGEPMLAWLVAAMVAAAFGGLAFLTVCDRLMLPRALREAPVLGGFARAAAFLGGDARRILLAGSRTAGTVALAAAVHVLMVAVVLVLARGLGIGLDPFAALALVPPVILVAYLPVSYAGWGLREGAMVVALGFAGVAPEAAVTLSLLFGAVMLAAALPGLALWLAAPSRRAA